jgi:hypothetical protein
MKLALNRHYPEYPVCDESGVLPGTCAAIRRCLPYSVFSLLGDEFHAAA